MAVQRVTSWFRGVPDQDDVSGRPVTVHRRNLEDYASDVENAQRMIERRRAELAQAEQMLTEAQAAFIAHCRERNLPMVMEPGIWPPREWLLES